MIMTLATNGEFLGIEMEAIWKLVETCIIPEKDNCKSA